MTFFVVLPPSGGVAISSIGAAADGTAFNLVSPAAVPEASTIVSCGLLLALGGFVGAAKRKKMAGAAGLQA